jgi:hypothetical protein
MNDYAPEVGDLVVDTARDKVGEVMDGSGSYVQLRPPGGGLEWDARPDDLRLADASDRLRVRVAEENHRSRCGR